MNPYSGEVAVELEPGLTATLRFTWASRAMIRQVFGEAWQEAVAQTLVTRDPKGLAVLLEAATDSKVTTAQALASDWPLSLVAEALMASWRFSHHGMAEPEKAPNAHPTKPRQTLSHRLLKLLRLPGLIRPASGA